MRLEANESTRVTSLLYLFVNHMRREVGLWDLANARFNFGDFLRGSRDSRIFEAPQNFAALRSPELHLYVRRFGLPYSSDYDGAQTYLSPDLTPALADQAPRMRIEPSLFENSLPKAVTGSSLDADLSTSFPSFWAAIHSTPFPTSKGTHAMTMDIKRRVSRACDACKLRKVKCNGEMRCSQCAHTGLKCIYSSTAKPRSQGRRGRVISEYKQQTSNPSRQLAPLLPRKDEADLDKNYFYNLIPEYMSVVYPVQPIMNEDEVRQSIAEMDIDKEAYSYVHAFGACTLNLSYVGKRRTPEIVEAIERLATESIKSRTMVTRGYKSSLRQCMISLHLHNCFMTMRDSDASFFYMRDAITMVQLLGIELPANMTLLPLHERAKRQRLYWEAFIHERFLSILDYRQAVMRPLESLPEHDPTIPPLIEEGFNQIIRLFQLLDVDFLQNWLGNHDSSITPAWIENKQAELDQQMDAPEGNYEALNSMQKADLVVTKQWLKTLVWRLAMSNTLLSSSSPKECLSLLFPVRLSKQLRQQLSVMTKDDIEIHGSGIVQKLFEITDTIADVIIAAPAHSIQDTANRVDDFLFLAEYLFSFPILDSTRKGMLNEKLDKLQQMFPELGSNPSSPEQPPFFAAFNSPDGPWYGATESMLPITVTSPTVTASTPGDDVPPPIFPHFANGSLYTQYNEIARRLSVADFASMQETTL